MQYLYELNDPNLGNYSPTNQFVGITASESIERMRSSDFDPRKDVILHKSISGTLESATSSVLIFEKGYMRVKANSPSQSLLVLPLQYSHCLEIDTIKSQKNDDIELLKANVGLTAIRFSGNIDYKITLGFGPYSNFGCRLLDYSEARNFLKK